MRYIIVENGELRRCIHYPRVTEVAISLRRGN
ncbi:hypothetical protein [Enterococcus phage vB_Efs8_KEN04]